MPLFYNKNLKSLAKKLRKSLTRQEKHLWYDFLANYPIRFHRQKLLGNYIVDFYCHEAMLVVELDGSQHYENEYIMNDAERTAYLNSQGLQVLRYTNGDVDNNFEGVCMMIDRIVKQEENLPPQAVPLL